MGWVERRLLRHPLRREVRPHLVQGLNIGLCCLFLGGVVSAGGAQFARIWLSLNDAQFNLLTAAFTAGVLLLAALAFVPSRRVNPAINVVVALCSGFLGLQLAAISTAPSEAVVLDSPLAGSGRVQRRAQRPVQRSLTEREQRHGLHRLGANGRTHTGGSDAVHYYAGFGWPVLAPADGRIVEVTEAIPTIRPAPTVTLPTTS